MTWKSEQAVSTVQTVGSRKNCLSEFSVVTTLRQRHQALVSLECGWAGESLIAILTCNK